MTALRPLQPTAADFRKWRRLIRATRAAVKDRRGAGGDLRAAAATARKAVAPTRELQLSVCSPFIRLAETWPTLGNPCRAAAAETLSRFADALAPHVGGTASDPHPPAPAAQAMPVPMPDPDTPPRQPRLDIYG
ncbi:hypothetical protein [Brevundimonas sp.]|uniref:hypothetical protein n=1 Tax=Brevundimonas sp. TaxID=1871086 RepID=UPI002899BC4A|nr:hypothetical protein [Brevundimonas sp.]